ncbi:MAG: alpha/beta fold hydrolase [Novosphingobium sp.]
MTLPRDASQPHFDRRSIPAGAREGVWRAADGHAIRRIDWPAPEGPPRGSVLFFGGRGDAYEKYLETFEHWRGQGWQVTAADWRGQAGSGRLGLDDRTGHIDDFSTWVADLAALWRDWKAETPGPHVLAGHSMGGHLVLRALAEGKVDPVAAVLSAPMLGFLPDRVPLGLLQAAAKLMCKIGDRRRLAWKWSEKPGQLPEGRIALLTHDEARYADEVWWREARPALAMGPGSWGWVERAYASMRLLARPGALERIATPVFIVATTADRLVAYGAIARAAKRLPNAELLTLGDEARHEVLREADAVRNRVLGAIDAFLDRAAPAQ